MNRKNISPTVFVLLNCALLLVSSLVSTSVLGQTNTLQVYVGNQGNFSDANGSVSLYSPEDGSVDVDVVPGLNTLVQSISIHNGAGYIIGNTSDRIDVIDLETNQRVAQIREVSSPRFMEIASDDKAYVSNLFANSITIIDLVNNAVVGSISVGVNPEDIVVIDDKAYVANYGFGTADSTLSVIDVATDSVLDTITPGCDGPRFLEADQDSELWVFCNGKTVFNEDFTEIIEETNGEVVVFDSGSGLEVARIELDAQTGATSLGQDAWYDPTSNRMFFVKGVSILVFDASTNELSSTIEISGEEEIGAVAYDPGADVLYLGRVTGFTSSGFVSIHNMEGAEVDRFAAGVAPAFIAFYDPFSSTVGIDDLNPVQVSQFQLEAAFPNPFSGRTSIPFHVDKASRYSLAIYNALGQRVAVLLDEYVLPGQYVVEWVSDAPGGLYYYQLSTNKQVETRLVTRIR